MGAFQLKTDEFNKLTDYIRSEIGINITPVKKVMLETRLRKRLTSLNLSSVAEYIEYLFSPQGQKVEKELFINVVTTNKTDFFREPHHFTYMNEIAVPELLTVRKQSSMRVWSAACSVGAEPYTLAIVLEELKRDSKNGLRDFTVYATDISTHVLAHAQKAVYSETDIQPVPVQLRYRYFMKSKEKESDAVRVVPELRKKVMFNHLNLMNPFRFSSPVDIIFCRNVMIYFKRETQINLVHRMIQNLVPGGYLFMGHSEVLEPQRFGLISCAPSVYRKPL